MTNEDKELADKIMRFIEFAKKEFPGCYKKMMECCQDTGNESKK